ncbi:MAG: corrinoid protein [Thermoleophilia bacterium]|nr:corrinoid protein [Thermoleophilia bacterium]
MINVDSIANCVIVGRADADSVLGEPGTPGVRELTEQAIAAGMPVREILRDGLLAGMAVVGERMRNDEVFIPEVLQSAQALQAGLALLKPLFAESGVRSKGKVVIGTVEGDVHGIGKTLVGMVMEGAGFEVKDLGVDIPVEAFVSAVEAEDPDIVAMSAMLTTTMPVMKRVIDSLDEARLRPRVRVMVGGAPLTQEFADEIRADIYAPDASSAVNRMREFLGVETPV